MWPFDDSLRNQLRNQDMMKKYRDWLKKWLFKGNKLGSLKIIGIVLSISLLSAYGFYTWYTGQANNQAITTKSNNSQVIQKDCQQSQPACEQTKETSTNQPVEKLETKQTSAQPVVNPEEMVKPVMGHALTGVGMTFSEVFKDYRYNTGVALAADPGAEVKTAMAGTISLVATGDNGTKQVSINHGNGWESTYSGLEQVQVKAGQKLAQNEVLGTLGKYSRTNGVMENHLYFKITRNGEPVDPNIYWK